MILKFGRLSFKLNETSDANVRLEVETAMSGENHTAVMSEKISPEEANTLASGLKEMATMAKRRRR